MTLTNPSINARYSEPIPLLISTVSQPTESRCHVVIYKNERTNEKRGLVRGGHGNTRSEIAELFGPNGCESCCFCISYGTLSSTEIATAEYQMRYMGTGRLGRRWRDTSICQSCYLAMSRDEEKRHANAMQELAYRYGGAK